MKRKFAIFQLRQFPTESCFRNIFLFLFSLALRLCGQRVAGELFAGEFEFNQICKYFSMEELSAR